jgi:hypothetical protein
MARTITRSYQSYEDARAAVVRLEEAGVRAADISLIGRQETGDDSAVEGAGIGGLIGGGAGLLAGLGVIAIPGIGPVVAVGWLASTITGAAVGAVAGGVVGAMTDAGVSEDDAHYYAESIRRGGSLVSVRASDEQAAAVEAILDGARPIDPVARRAEYQREGWTRFDERAGPYSPPTWSDLT